MKKSLWLPAMLSLLIGASIFSCNKKEQFAPGESHQQLAKYSTGCYGSVSSFFDTKLEMDHNIDLVAKLHNEYLADFYNQAYTKNIIFNGADYNDFVRETSKSYFEGIGISITDNSFYGCQSTVYADSTDNFRDTLSGSGQIVYDSILSTMLAYETLSAEQFSIKMNACYTQAGYLTEQESIALKMMIRVGQRSFEYWEDHFDQWTELIDINSIQQGGKRARKGTASRTQVLIATACTDANGAAVGGFLGWCFGGPAGGFAFGLVKAGWDSATSLVVRRLLQ